MHASSVNFLLADSGSAGVELLRALIKFTRSSDPISRFVDAKREVANRWVRARPSEMLGERLELKQADLDAVYGSGVVAAISAQLALEPEEVVRLLNETLFAGARLSSPDGERVSERAAKRLDDVIRSELS